MEALLKKLQFQKKTTVKRQPRASQEQVDAMVDYLLLHPQVATGKFVSLQGTVKQEGSWEELAELLNAMNRKGAKKTVESWKNTFRDNKTFISRKIQALRSERVRYGNSSTSTVFTERDKKLLSLMGWEYMEQNEESSDTFTELQVGTSEQLSSGDIKVLHVEPAASTTRQLVEEIDENNAAENNDFEFISSTFTVNANEQDNDDQDAEDPVTNVIDFTQPSSSTQQATEVASNQTDIDDSSCSIRSADDCCCAKRRGINGTFARTSKRFGMKIMKRGRKQLTLQLAGAWQHYTKLQDRHVSSMETLTRAAEKQAEVAVMLAENAKAQTELLKDNTEVMKGMLNLLNTLNEKMNKC